MDATAATDTNAIAIYIAGLEWSKAKYPECPAAHDIYRAIFFKYDQKPWFRIEIRRAYTKYSVAVTYA